MSFQAATANLNPLTQAKVDSKSAAYLCHVRAAARRSIS
jgi:hypothetical protein